MAFNAAIFTGMGQAARAKQNRDRDQRTTILGNLSTLYSTLAADPYWSTPQQQQLLGQAQMELKTADPGDRKASSKSILKWGNLIKVGAIPDTPPQPPQEQTILSGEAADPSTWPGYGSTYDPNFVGPLPPLTPQQQANVLEAGHPEGGGVPPTGAPGAPGAGMFGLAQAPTRPPIEDWAADRRLSEQQRTQLDAWRGYQDSMAGFNVAFNDMVQKEALIQRRYDILKRANLGFTPEQIYSLMGMEVDEPLPPHYRDPDIAKTVEDWDGRVWQYNPATGKFDKPVGGYVGDFQEPDEDLQPPREGTSLWDAVERGKVTGVWSSLGKLAVGAAGLFESYEHLSPEQRQGVQDREQYNLAYLNLLNVLSNNPRYPEGEANRIMLRAQMDPKTTRSSGQLLDQLVSLDRSLRIKLIDHERNMNDRRGFTATERTQERRAASDIRRFLNELNVPVHLRDLRDIEDRSPDSFTPQQKKDLLDRWDQEQGREGPIESLSEPDLPEGVSEELLEGVPPEPLPVESLSEESLRARNIARNTDEDGLVRLFHRHRGGNLAVPPYLVDAWLEAGAVFSDPVEDPTTAGDIPQNPRRSRSRRNTPRVEAAPMPPI